MSQPVTNIYNEPSSSVLSIQISINNKNNNNGTYACELCDFISLYKSVVIRHFKYSCKNNPNKKSIRPDKIKFKEEKKNPEFFHTKEKYENLGNSPSIPSTNTVKLIKNEYITDSLVLNESSIDLVTKTSSIKENIMSPLNMENNIESTTKIESIKKHEHVSLYNSQLTEHSAQDLLIPSIPSVSISDLLMLKILENQENQKRQHNELIEQLKKTIEYNKAINIEESYFNIEKIQIFLTDQIDFVEVLTKRYGSREKAINHIKNRIHEKQEGDVALFCDIYLNGEPDTWPINCLDWGKHTYKIAQANNKPINDPDGLLIYKNFRVAYANNLLSFNTTELSNAFKHAPEDYGYKNHKDFVFTLRLLQDKADSLYSNNTCDIFIKKLTERFRIIKEYFCNLQNAL